MYYVSDKIIKALFILLIACMSACSLIIRSATEQIANNLSIAILSQNDPQIVREAAPAYLVLIDGLIKGEPEQVSLLLAGAKLNSAYATIFVDDEKRTRQLTEKAWNYSQRALCLAITDDCQAFRKPYSSYLDFLNTLDEADVPVLYTFAASWANWIQTHTDDWNARADLPKVQASMQRILQLNEQYRQGEPQIYLGVLFSVLPPALGGKPELAQSYFERAIELSGGRNLMFKVIYAQRYARLLFDRQLHDHLLQEVLQADPVEPDLTLMNTIAQDKAQALLDSADDYF